MTTSAPSTATLTRSNIDMFTPAETCSRLMVSETQLLDLVNSGELPAYNLGGSIRFKISDVLATN